jgi:dolichyl-phosphate-mannose-protein mannosyltransferase
MPPKRKPRAHAAPIPSPRIRPAQFEIFHFHHKFANPDLQPFSMTILDWLFFVATIGVSLFTHLFKLGWPANVVFDEVYFGNFTHYYANGTYFFDIHPPLGKELLYLGSRLSGYHYKEIYSEIGARLNFSQIRRLRFWPCFTGALRAPLMFMTFKLLGVSPWWALTFALFVATDQALISESRYVLIDAYLSMFASLTILLTAFLASRINKMSTQLMIVIGAGLAAGATVSVKFTGGGVALTVALALMLHYPFFAGVGHVLIAGLCGLLVLFVSFVVHFLLLNHAGNGCIFHPPDFCAKLERRELGVFEAMTELIPRMLESNFAISESHSYSSPWWSWPFLLGLGTYQWVKDDCQTWAIGSPIVWWGGTIGLIVWCVAVSKNPNIIGTAWLFFGWAVSYLPFSLIKRVMWNYHYFIPLLYSLGATAVAANSSRQRLSSCRSF